jgi:hypothetical protein
MLIKVSHTSHQNSTIQGREQHNTGERTAQYRGENSRNSYKPLE